MTDQPTTPTVPDALGVLFGQEEYQWVETFRLRGRTYTLTTGCTTTREGSATVPVFNSAGHRTMITVRSTDRVEVLTRR
jgi:hypothetical protein